MGEPVNPFAKAKVGDWVEYRMIIGGLPGGNGGVPANLPEMKARIVVTAMTEKEATLEFQVVVGGVGGGAVNNNQKMVIDLTKPFDPVSFLDVGNKGKAKSERKAEGREKITIGDKKYECAWITVKSGDPGLEDVKIWHSKDVPLVGLVRLEGKSAGLIVTMELTGSGRK